MSGEVAYRLMVDPPATGTWNMAVDEALLQSAIEENIATLRLYQWSEPTLSLGYFQRLADRDRHAASRRCSLVRRQSGGGAILHDRELTYSLALPASHHVTRDATALYHAVHEAFLCLLTPYLQASSESGRMWLNGVNSPLSATDEPFLCFERRSRGDLLLRVTSQEPRTHDAVLAYKILGSAQRRHRGALLQHGSFLLARSQAAPELPGWLELVGGDDPMPELIASLPQHLGTVVSTEWIGTGLPDAIREAAKWIERAKYSNRSWTERR